MKRKTDQLVVGQLAWMPKFPAGTVLNNDDIPSPAALFSRGDKNGLSKEALGNVPFGSAVMVLHAFEHANHLNRLQDEYVIKAMTALGVGYMWRGFLSDKNPAK